MSDAPKFMNPRGEIQFQKNRLPHWEQDGCTYFITFRLADSLPKRLLDEWTRELQIWAKHNPKPWSVEKEREYRERFSRKREAWLDAGYGACVLSSSAARQVIAAKLANEDAIVWSFVIMPNHVHILVSPRVSTVLSDWIQNLKGGSSFEINRLIERSGKLWAKDYFDRLVRDDSHFRRCARYVQRNPQNAGLSEERFSLWESDYVRWLLRDR